MPLLLNVISLLPITSYIVISLWLLLTANEIYTNYHWFLLGLISLHANAKSQQALHPVVSTLFSASIIANSLIILSQLTGPSLTTYTLLPFVCFLLFAYLLVIINKGLVIYRKKYA